MHSVQEQDILDFVRSYGSPISIEEIAQKMKAMRVKVVRMVKNLSQAGYIDKVEDESSSVIKFIINESAQSLDKEQAPVAKEKPVEKKADPVPHVARKSFISDIPKAIDIVKQEAAQAKADPTADDIADKDALKARIIHSLGKMHQQMPSLSKEFGDVESILDEMVSAGLISSTAIWRGDDPVFQKLPAADEFLKSINYVADKDSHKQAKKVSQASPVSAVSILESQEKKAKEVVKPKDTRAPDSIDSKILPMKRQAPKQQEEEIGVPSSFSDEIVDKIKSLIDDAVNQRMLEAESTAQSDKKEALADIGNSIMAATQALKLSIDALDDLSKKIKRL